jgi:hypothetical protein
VPQEQHDDRAQRGDEHRCQVEVEDVEIRQPAEDRAADQRADQAAC